MSLDSFREIWMDGGRAFFPSEASPNWGDDVQQIVARMIDALRQRDFDPPDRQGEQTLLEERVHQTYSAYLFRELPERQWMEMQQGMLDLLDPGEAPHAP